MKRSNGRVTSFWVVLAAVVIVVMMKWERPIPPPPPLPTVRTDTVAVPKIILSAPRPMPRPPWGARTAAPAPKPLASRRSPTSMRAVVGETLSVTMTQYCLRGLTRLDNPTRDGIIAADPRVFPLRREVDLFMNGQLLGRYRVDDTGLLIKGRIVDIWVPDCSAARRFGRKKGKAVLIAKEP